MYRSFAPPNQYEKSTPLGQVKVSSNVVKLLSRNNLSYFRESIFELFLPPPDHRGRGESDQTPPAAISRTNGRIEPHEAAFESSPLDIPRKYLRF